MEKQEIIKFVEEQGSWGLSDFQSRYFVVHSQVTNYRRVRQAMLELETRIAAKKQIERNMKKTEIETKIKQRDFENEADILKKQLIEVDIDQFNYDMSVYVKKYRIVKEEIDKFVEIINQVVPDLKELESYQCHNEEEEKKYWIARMGKQACMDLMSSGRIGAGNLDSICMMNLEDQISTIQTALMYNAHLSTGIKNIEAVVHKQLKESGNSALFVALEAITAPKTELNEAKNKGEQIK